MPPAGTGRFVFRPWLVIACVLTCAVMSTGIVWLLAFAATPDPWNAIPFFAGLLGVPLAIRRALRISVVADDRGVRVKNYWRTRSLAWDDIAEVTGAWTTLGPTTPVPVIALVTRDRRLVRILATATDDKHKRALIRALKDCPEMRHVTFSLPGLGA